MLNVEWKELEEDFYATSSVEEGEQRMFKINLFKRIRERLDQKTDPITVVNQFSDAIEEIKVQGWDTLTYDTIMKLVESVVDYILPRIDLPGPDVFVRPLVKLSILNSVSRRIS